MPSLLLIRGLPGSGKSTLARALADQSQAKWFEADMFFETDGVYRFDPSRLREAHEWCQAQAAAALAQGFPVVVSNTFSTRWEMEPYLRLAPDARVVHVTTYFGSIHGVPDFAIQRMKDRWEPFPGEVIRD